MSGWGTRQAAGLSVVLEQAYLGYPVQVSPKEAACLGLLTMTSLYKSLKKRLLIQG